MNAERGLASAPEGLPRRAFLRRAAAGTAVAAATTGAQLLRLPEAAAAPSDLVADDPELHLLRRATFGPSEASVKRIRAIGVNAWLEEQLDPDSVGDAFCEDLIARRIPRVGWGLTRAWNDLEAGSWDIMFDLGVATIARACWSNRQLFEVMVDFWSNHLNVTNPFDGGWWNRQDYDNNVIRRHALGRFEDMLQASATHPAMMLYLNNAESTKYSPNENYGRELLELHTVGVNGGYDETDMRNSALVMTGFGINWETGKFEYHGYYHHTGPVQVMGWSSNNPTGSGGYEVGLDYVRWLARRPATAEHLAWKLCRRFVADDPPQGLVDTLAEIYLDNGTAIVPVLRKLFRSAAFKGAVGEKVRRPFEDVAATIRTVGIRPDAHGRDGLNGLYWFTDELGHLPLNWSQPDGYPDTAEEWSSAGGTLGRWNAHVSLAAGGWPSELVRPSLKKRFVPKPLPDTYGELLGHMARRLVHRPLPPDHRDAVLGFFGKTAGSRLRSGDEAIGWRLPYLVALILDSPSHLIR
jgi:hypothetical protein